MISAKSPFALQRKGAPLRRVEPAQAEGFVLEALDQLKSALAQLKTERPEAVVELQLTGDEKAGMVSELEKAVEANRLKLQR